MPEHEGKKTQEECVACTWRPESYCEEHNCDLHGPLACRWDPKEYTFLMHVVQSPPSLIAVFAFVLVGLTTGNWWSFAILGWLVIMWPLGLETYVLCRHCPYFTDEGKTLTCWALRYEPIWWKYDPRPLNRWETFVVTYLLFMIPMLLWPMGWTAYGVYFIARDYQSFGLVALMGMIGMLFAVAVSAIQFFLILWSKACNRCVNYSCPFNKVPKETVDAYLRLNPCMKEAWVEHGYELGVADEEQ